ncbi:phosphonate ABC transporter substrate-binding protein [Roseicyclus mahoneyensis]|uniref:Phosphonate transport system substrate-binding protein n=1 Tax=Roseicyclus mahoneyensis TaxID=164332 RepID=A0A316GST5_9RHOB|nr:phosphonate ABC transporter substrate-binding protein [Roseicyclus mahoneyensis]PWK58097.1 phosphonate transport system substrate-binding protein [Roseicyclus mahoneyensis]
MFKTTLAALVLGATALTSTAAFAQDDWRAQMGSFNIGILGGENEADRLRRNECYGELISEVLGVPVQLFPAADYAGVMQGLLAGQLHMAGLGAASYAGIYLQDPDAVEPVLTRAQLDGTLGYYAVMVVRSDSDIQSLEDMQGRSLAYADPNSTSGYLVPRGQLALQGINDEEYFGTTGFGGGHEQAVVAVLNEQYDAAVTWISGQGDFSDGFSRGNLRRMVDNGLLDMNDIRIVWTSDIIPNGPTVFRQDLPEEARALMMEFLLSMQAEHPECYALAAGGDDGGFVEIDHAFYESTIALREVMTEAR